LALTCTFLNFVPASGTWTRFGIAAAINTGRWQQFYLKTMSDKKIDITSTAIEKGLDIAKDFLDKLIIPTVEETGLLF
jgi:hypothetical protein